MLSQMNFKIALSIIALITALFLTLIVLLIVVMPNMIIQTSLASKNLIALAKVTGKLLFNILMSSYMIIEMLLHLKRFLTPFYMTDKASRNQMTN